ncbi:hypothetical protein SK128_011988, partial [Halocaridina rubra]
SGHRKKPPTSHPTSITSGPCQFSTRQHGPGKSQSAKGTCHNCGCRGYWANTAKDAQFHFCSKTEH